jgi:hypothetical protein
MPDSEPKMSATLTLASRGTFNLDCINVAFPARLRSLLPPWRTVATERKFSVSV